VTAGNALLLVLQRPLQFEELEPRQAERRARFRAQPGISSRLSDAQGFRGHPFGILRPARVEVGVAHRLQRGGPQIMRLVPHFLQRFFQWAHVHEGSYRRRIKRYADPHLLRKRAHKSGRVARFLVHRCRPVLVLNRRSNVHVPVAGQARLVGESARSRTW
jgi:hypothetical protein